jgi:hypothetical protein
MKTIIANERRTYPSSALAFRNHCDYACALEIHRPRLGVDDWVMRFAAVCMVAAAFWIW